MHACRLQAKSGNHTTNSEVYDLTVSLARAEILGIGEEEPCPF